MGIAKIALVLSVEVPLINSSDTHWYTCNFKVELQAQPNLNNQAKTHWFYFFFFSLNFPSILALQNQKQATIALYMYCFLTTVSRPLFTQYYRESRVTIQEWFRIDW